MSTTEDDDLQQEDSFWGQLDDEAPVADWSGDELEEAYMKAMEALEASDAQLPHEVPAPAAVSDMDVIDRPVAPTLEAVVIPSEDRIGGEELKAELAELSEQTKHRQAPAPAAVLPRQIIEALMFVGGEPLTTRKLSNVLRGEFSAEFIESEVNELNDLYTREGRPYEIRLGDGGYRMTLRENFERIRRKAYGMGPKEVKLSQEAIEVLAVVAYHQPITAEAVDELGKPGSGAILRQLLRRELIAVDRTGKRSRDVAYRTTPRFLSLFGIRSLNELPRLEQVAYK